MDVPATKEEEANKDADQDGASQSASKISDLTAIMVEMAELKDIVARYVRSLVRRRLQIYMDHSFLISQS